MFALQLQRSPLKNQSGLTITAGAKALGAHRQAVGGR
jgi:hypothetical protein